MVARHPCFDEIPSTGWPLRDWDGEKFTRWLALPLDVPNARAVFRARYGYEAAAVLRDGVCVRVGPMIEDEEAIR